MTDTPETNSSTNPTDPATTDDAAEALAAVEEATEVEAAAVEEAVVEEAAAEVAAVQETVVEEAAAAEDAALEEAAAEVAVAEEAVEVEAAAEVAAGELSAEDAAVEVAATEEALEVEAAAQVAAAQEAIEVEAAAEIVAAEEAVTEEAVAAMPTAPVVSSGAPAAKAAQQAPVSPTTPSGAPRTAGTPLSMSGFASGELVKGTVTSVDKSEIELDLGDGKVGVIGARHWTSGLIVDLTNEVKVDDRVEGAVLARTDPKQRIVLSRVWARQKRAWESVEEAKKTNGTISAIVTDAVKGGLAVSIDGLRGFLPASLVDEGNVADLDPFINQKIDVRVLEADRAKARLLVSRKAAMRAQARAQAKEAMTDMEVGTELEGTVVQITDFGAFVDVDGIRGLVHRSEMGWGRSSDPANEVTVGQQVKVKVVKIQPKKNRLGLSMRVGEDPLKAIKKGARLRGPITRLVDFGVFVEIAPGLEGLVHVSEMADYRVYQPEEVVMPGDVVTVKVLGTDKKRRTVDLSMREAYIPELNIEVPNANGDAEHSASGDADTDADDGGGGGGEEE